MHLSWRELHGLFPTSSGVRQDCVLVPALFRIAIDWIMSIYVQTRQVSASDSPCSETLTMQMMHFCSLRTMLSGHPSLSHLIQLRTLWAFIHPGQKLKFKILPPDLHHLPVSYQDIKWKWSIG